MTLHLFDTATRAEREFVPLHPGRVGIYVCGPTVQGSPHVGHLRAFVAFDVLQRWLERSGDRVTMIRNVTDIDDKILAKAEESGVDWWALAMTHEREFARAFEALGLRPADYEPRATSHVPEVIEFIADLVERGHAYDVSGSVYFDVQSFPDYGQLTNQALGDMAPAADSPADSKRDPRDFALWKSVADDAVAQWNSPWGPGRPGWHIECSAMARRFLGDTFDIHGGGLDLRFPHHENEQAQSRAAGYGFANLWMHSAWVTQAGAKMSKSLGNGLLVSEVLATYPAAALRLALASVHYRSMMEYTDTIMDDATATWNRLAGFVQRASEKVSVDDAVVRGAALPEPFVEAMDEDLTVPRAMAHVHETVRVGNAALTAGDDAAIRSSLLAVRAMLDVLGLDPLCEQWRETDTGSVAIAALDQLVQADLDARAQAREAKDWAQADAIRDRLAAAGIVIEDSTEGARWSLAPRD